MERRRFVRVFFVSSLVLGSFVAGRSQAADVPENPAAAFIRQVGRELPGVVGDATTIEARRARLKPFLARVVAVDRVARFCLGAWWNAATPAQRAEYTGLFLDTLTNTVAQRFGAYGQGRSTVAVLPPRVEAESTAVPTLVRTGDGPQSAVTWVVDTSTQPYRVLDVIAEGMSLRLSTRADFSSYLARHGGDVAGFLAALRAHAG